MRDLIDRPTPMPGGLPDYLRWLFGGALLTPIIRALGAVIVVAGPWLLSVLVLALLSISLDPVLGRSGLEDLRQIIILSLFIAPLVAGPCGAIAAQALRHSKTGTDHSKILTEIVGALCLSGLGAMVLAIFACVLFGISDLAIAFAFGFLSTTVALMWVSILVLTAQRRFSLIVAAFGAGLMLSLCLSLWSMRIGANLETLIWCFSSGIVLCLCISITAATRNFYVLPGADGRTALIRFGKRLYRMRYLAMGIGISFFGIWIDKIVMWLGPEGMRTASNLPHFSPYDSALFLAHLSTIPLLAALFLIHEGPIKDAILSIRARMQDHSSYARLQATIQTGKNTIWQSVFMVIILQAAISTICLLAAPLAAFTLRFDLHQIALLQGGILAAFLHSIFYLFCSILVLCNCQRLFFALQLYFFFANLILSVTCLIFIGVTAYALFFSAMSAALLAFPLAYWAVQNYAFVSLLGENDSLFAKKRKEIV